MAARCILKDIAELYDSKEEPTSLTRVNGKTSLGIQITKTSDGNTVGISEEVKKALVSLEKQYSAENMHFTISSDSADFTLEAANSVIHDLLIAVVLRGVDYAVFPAQFPQCVDCNGCHSYIYCIYVCGDGFAWFLLKPDELISPLAGSGYPGG